MPDTGASGAQRPGRPIWLAMLGLAMLVVLIRLPSLAHPGPLDDETVYALVANEIVQGGLPYVDAVERKPPLLFWTYAAVFDLFGPSNWLALHVAATLWTLATMAGVGVLAARLFDRDTGLAAALLYACFHAWGPWTDLAFNGEMLMNLPLAWAFAAALRREDRSLGRDAAMAGLLLGTAFLLKQPALIAALPLTAALACRGWPPGLSFPSSLSFSRIRRPTICLALFGLGTALPILAAAAILHAQHILAQGIYWTVGDHDLPHVFWSRAVEHTAAFAVACLPALAAAAVAIRSRAWAGRLGAMRVVLLWLATSAIGAAAGGRFYPHYYIQLLPPIAVLGAPALASAWRSARAAPWPLRPVWIAITVAAVWAGQWWQLAPRRTPMEAARYVHARTATGDRIFVWGHMPQIYLDADRRPASRYILTFPLTGYVFGPVIPGLDTRDRILPTAWPNLAKDFARHPPAVIVDTEVTSAARYPLAAFPRFKAMVERDFPKVTRLRDATVYERAR